MIHKAWQSCSTHLTIKSFGADSEISSDYSVLYSNVLQYYTLMGNECTACTPSQKYKKYFSQLNVSELKDRWPAIKIFKMKKIFDQQALPLPDQANQLHLPEDHFKLIFNQLDIYPPQQVHRLFEFFDLQNQGYIDWNSFFSAISICYFADTNTLALIMFMMYDVSLDFKLDCNYLQLLLQNNEHFFRANQNGIPPLWEDVLRQINSTQQVSVQDWQLIAEKHFDMAKFRSVFNLFQQQKLQKELVRKFHSWNSIFDQQEQKFIGYLINLKWFQSWTLYIHQHYNVKIDIYSQSPATLATIKTLKSTTFKSVHKIDRSAIDSKSSLQPEGKKKTIKSYVRDIDFVHGNIGERPGQITNSEIEGEYQDILKPQLSQNIDYVIVGQKVWVYLQNIYGGSPEFRRSGFDGIELYPKIVRIYLSLFKGQIDYSSQIRREVSSYYKLQQVLSKSCDISPADLPQRGIFFKTTKMKQWYPIEDPSILFEEITQQELIFLVCIPKQDIESFGKSHLKPVKNINQINLGDTVILKDEQANQKAVFMGKTTEGKYILHLQTKHYTEDICLLQTQLHKRCSLYPEQIESLTQRGNNCKQLSGLPAGPGLGFINSTLLHLFAAKQLQRFFKMYLPSNQDENILHRLSTLFTLLQKKEEIESKYIKQTIQNYMCKYGQFEVSMCSKFIQNLLQEISSSLQQEHTQDIVSDNYQLVMQKQISCLGCKKEFVIQSNHLVYKLHLPEETYNYFQVYWVPVDSNPIRKFYIKVQKDATLGDFQKEIERQLGIHSKKYILTEVHCNDIVKNFSSVPKTGSLNALKIRQHNQYFAYELKSKFSSFVSKYYNKSESVDDNCIKKDKFIDCKHPDKGWIFGKIVDVEFLPYTQTEIVRVMHKFSKNQSWEVNYQVIDSQVARYPLKSHNNCEQYHLRVHQRCYNQASNSMKLVNLPLVVALPAWIRWKQFSFYVYLQIRQFIANQYSFNSQSDQHIIPTSKQFKKPSQVSMAEKFKEYRNGSKFPYVLNLCDYQGRCVVCYKFVKSVVFKGQHEHYCQGCKLSTNDPISWLAKPADLIVCIDWKSQSAFKNNLINESIQVESVKESKEKYDIQAALNEMGNRHIENEQFRCCNKKEEKVVTEKVINTKNNLIVYVQRIVEQEDGFKNVLKTAVKYQQKGLKIANKLYDLAGVTAIQGDNLNMKYKTFTRKNNKEWYCLNNQSLSVVDTAFLEKQCVLALYYELAC